MPELPDVEVFRQYLESTARNQKVRKVDVRDAKILKKISVRNLRAKTEGSPLGPTQRRGKYLFVSGGRGGWLVFHFGMTGYFRYFGSEDSSVEKHDRVLFHCANGKTLAFTCRRKLGFVSFTPDVGQYIENKELGPDALDLDLKGFEERLDKARGALKPLLMNQKWIAGIGNVYSDEILFQASLHPKASVSSLDGKKRKSLFRRMRKVLETAVAKKADAAKLPRSYLTRQRKAGVKCPKCGEKIRRMTVSGRSCYYCPGHQKNHALT